MDSFRGYTRSSHRSANSERFDKLTENSDTIRSIPSGTTGRLAIDPHRKFKRIPGPATCQSGAFSVIDDTGNCSNFKCPQCGEIAGTSEHEKNCTWVPEPSELHEILSRDPERIPANCYNAKMEQYLPRFDKNLKPMSGKERRNKKFLSKCSF